MLKQFTGGPRTHLDPLRDGLVARGRWYQRVGRIFLLGAAFGGGVEMILRTVLGGTLPPVTLGSIVDVTGIAQVPPPIGLALDLPLWIVLLIAAAVPYAIAAHQFVKQRPIGDGARRPVG